MGFWNSVQKIQDKTLPLCSMIVAAAGAAGISATPSAAGIESAITVGRLTDIGFLIVMMPIIISRFRSQNQVRRTQKKRSRSPRHVASYCLRTVG